MAETFNDAQNANQDVGSQEEVKEEQTSQNTEPTSLPSEEEERQEHENMVNTWGELKETDPKFMEQFKSLEDFKEKYKELHKQYSNTVRDYKEKEKANQTEAEKQAEQEQVEQQQQETIHSMIPEFMDNNMQLTEDMEKRAEEAGIDVRDLKLGAIELREKVQKAHDTVGGREEYESMMQWASENLTDEQKKAFDKDVTSEMSEFAIKGLHNEYKKASGDRIRGRNDTGGIKPYRNTEEIMRDKRYLNTPAGFRDKNAQERHKERLSVTPTSVFS